MYRSLEIRWFFARPPFAREDFFGQATREKPRIDWYAPSDDDGCGIKTRGGKLETKLRSESRGVQEIAGLRGRVEEWCKWSVDLPSEEAIPEDVLEATGWIRVAKTRYVRFFAPGPSGTTEVDEPGEDGCQFEWTELQALGRAWWTVSFEAFGETSLLDSHLSAAAAHITAGGLPMEFFSEESSWGYPSWLRSLRLRGRIAAS